MRSAIDLLFVSSVFLSKDVKPFLVLSGSSFEKVLQLHGIRPTKTNNKLSNKGYVNNQYLPPSMFFFLFSSLAEVATHASINNELMYQHQQSQTDAAFYFIPETKNIQRKLVLSTDVLI